MEFYGIIFFIVKKNFMPLLTKKCYSYMNTEEKEKKIFDCNDKSRSSNSENGKYIEI